MNLSEIVISARSVITARDGRLSKALGYSMAFVGLGLTTASLGPTLPGLAEHTHSQLREVSYLFTARSLGYLMGSWLGGWFYDHQPGHPFMAVMLISIAAMLALVPTISLLWFLAVVLLIIGLAEGTIDVGGNTLLVWVYRHEVGPFMNGLHFFFGLGAFLSPIIIAQVVLRSGDINWAYWILAIVVVPIAFWLLRLDSPTVQTVSKDAPAGQSHHFLVYGFGNFKLRLAFRPEQQLLPVLFVIFFFLYVGAEVGFGGWVYTYAITLLAVPAETAAYLTSAFWGAFTVGRLAAIPLAARFRPRAILSGDLLGCLVSVALVLLWPASELVIWLAALGLGFSMASIFPTTISLAERRMVVTGRTTGWFLIGASAGAMFLPWLIGQLFESIGPQVVMGAILVDLVLALAIFAVLISRSASAVVARADQ